MKKLYFLQPVLLLLFACRATEPISMAYADQVELPAHYKRMPYKQVVEIFQMYPEIPIEQYIDPAGQTIKGSGYIIFSEEELHKYCKEETEYFLYVKERKAFGAFLFDTPTLTTEQYFSKRAEYANLEKFLKTRLPKSDSSLYAALLQQPYMYVTKDSILILEDRSRGKVSSLPGARCLNCD